MHENPYGAAFYGHSTAGIELKHSGVGIASFLLSILAGVALFALFAVAGYIESQSPSGMDEKDPTTMLLGLGLIASGMAQFMAAILGVVGLFQSNRKKLFAILGTIFSLMAILLFGGLMIFGLIVQANGG